MNHHIMTIIINSSGEAEHPWIHSLYATLHVAVLPSIVTLLVLVATLPISDILYQTYIEVYHVRVNCI